MFRTAKEIKVSGVEDRPSDVFDSEFQLLQTKRSQTQRPKGYL